MRGGKRRKKKRKKTSKKAEEDRSAKAVTDRQTNQRTSAALYCQYLTPAALLHKRITKHLQKRT